MPKEIRDLQKVRRKIKADYDKRELRLQREAAKHRDAVDYHEMELARVNTLRSKACSAYAKTLDDNHKAIIAANKGRLTIAQLMELFANENSKTTSA